jgi:gamma-glutamylcysteine synthetase
VIDLKTVIRGEAIGGVTKYGLLDELDALEMKIDRLASLSVEQYASIKDQIRELAAKESLKADEFQARVISIRRVG